MSTFIGNNKPVASITKTLILRISVRDISRPLKMTLFPGKETCKIQTERERERERERRERGRER